MFGHGAGVKPEQTDEAGTSHIFLVLETTAENGPWLAGGVPTVRGLAPGVKHYSGPGPSTVMDVGDAELTGWLLRRGEVRLELIHFLRPRSPVPAERPRTNQIGLSHLTVGVDDPDRTIAQLEARGVPVRKHTRATFVDGVPGYQFLFEDPDGLLIEAYTEWPDGKLPY